MAAKNLTKLERNIIKQVEHYFGDANLHRDKFMQSQLAAGDGWMTFAVLLGFNRLAALSNDAGVVAAALLKSDSGLLEISEDRRKLRRSPTNPQRQLSRKDVKTRTLYVKGFPFTASISELLDFFASYEKVAHIQLCKYLDVGLTQTYKFNGNLFAIFETRAQAKSFHDRRKMTYQEGWPLVIQWCK